MSGGIHIYRASDQPAVRYAAELDVGGKVGRHIYTMNPKRQIYVMCCKRRRIAANCIVHVYYDSIAFFCHHEYGCRGNHEREAKRRREYRNRSRAMKAMWAKRKLTNNRAGFPT